MINTYYVNANDMGTGATAESARDFARVVRRYFEHRGIEADVVVGVGLSDPELIEDGNRAFDVFCSEDFDVDATCAALGC